MKKQMKVTMAAILVLSAMSATAQTTDTTTAKARKHTTKKAATKAAPAPVVKKLDPVESTLSREVRELREKQAAQQAEIDLLTQANATKDAQLQQANASAAAATQTAQAATAQAQSVSATVQQNTDAVQALKSNVSDLQTTNAGLASTISANKVELTEKIDSPTVIHYKGVTITPVAFFAGEGVFRNRAVNSDVNTPFNSIPFPSANEGHVSELNFTGRQSRLGGLFEGNTGKVKIAGYFEADFLGVGTSSNNNQSNSYVFRQRVIYGQAALSSGFTITAGQQWSLVTEDGKGTDNRTEKLPNTIDSQYLVGFSWERQPSFRIQQRFGDYKTGALTIAVSAEQAQITNFTANQAVAGSVPVNFFFAGTGQNGGLYNAAGNIGANNTASTGGITNYANNVVPDFVAKFAYDNKWGHIELGGLARFLRDYYFTATPTGTVTAPTYTVATSGYQSSTKDAGGVFGSIRISATKYFDVAVQGMAGSGVGRYGSAQLADSTVHPDGTLAPIKNYHGMFSLETHPAPKLDLFAYYGGEYAKRLVYTTPQGDLIGYGPSNLVDTGCYNLPSNAGLNNGGTGGSIAATGTCNSPTKYIEEGMFGFTYRAIVSPKYGRLQYSATYSLVQRQLWAGIGSASTPPSPRAQDSMVHVSMRYYIP